MRYHQLEMDVKPNEDLLTPALEQLDQKYAQAIRIFNSDLQINPGEVFDHNVRNDYYDYRVDEMRPEQQEQFHERADALHAQLVKLHERYSSDI